MIITFDATTGSPIVLPQDAARYVGDAGIDGHVVRYWYACRSCSKYIEVALGETEQHECESVRDLSFRV